MKTLRFTESPWALMMRAAGEPGDFAGKLARFGGLLAAYANGEQLDAKLERLREIGYLDRKPTRAQLVAGSIDMYRFWVVPASEDYYRAMGIGFAMHQTLRILDEPASLADPLGLFSTRDAIIGHLMQVVHANPVYDLQLLRIYDDGLDELEAQIEEMLDGTHPRHRAISAIVEEADYHAKLLELVRAFRSDPRSAPPLLRSNVSASATFRVLERTFGQLPTAFRYFLRLDEDWSGALAHVRTWKTFPVHLGEPER
jgi:hypothetical protein